MTKQLDKLELSIGTVGAVIASEHFFSTLLSSPWTTQKFSETEKEKEIVRKMYLLASLMSMGFAVFISHLIKEKWPAIITVFLCVFYVIIYEKSLAKKL